MIALGKIGSRLLMGCGFPQAATIIADEQLGHLSAMLRERDVRSAAKTRSRREERSPGFVGS